MSAFVVRGVAVKHRFTALYISLATLGIFGAFAAGLQSHDRVLTKTLVVKQSVQQQYGAPDQSVPGEQVNPQLKGFVCDLYGRRAVVLCHR